MKRNKKKVFLAFLDSQGKWMMLLMISSIVGTVFAIIKRNYEPLFFSLYQFMNVGVGEGEGLNLLKDTISVYGLQLGALWVCGLFPVTRYLGVLIFLMTGISYSFTATSILLLYGVKGIFVALLTCGIQMCIVLYMMIHIASNSCIDNPKNKGVGKVTYYYIAGHVAAVAMGIGAINVYLQPYLEKMIIKIIR